MYQDMMDETLKKRRPTLGNVVKSAFLSVDGNERQKETLKETLRDLAESSSLHGIPKIVSSPQLAVKILWCLLFLGTFSIYTIQLITLFRSYYSYPVQTTVKLDFNSLPFPAITVCNMNPVRKSKIEKSDGLYNLISKKQSSKNKRRKKRATLKHEEDVQRSQAPNSYVSIEENNDIRPSPVITDADSTSCKEKRGTHLEGVSSLSEGCDQRQLRMHMKGVRRRKRGASGSGGTYTSVSDGPATDLSDLSSLSSDAFSSYLSSMSSDMYSNYDSSASSGSKSEYYYTSYLSSLSSDVFSSYLSSMSSDTYSNYDSSASSGSKSEYYYTSYWSEWDAWYSWYYKRNYDYSGSSSYYDYYDGDYTGWNSWDASNAYLAETIFSRKDKLDEFLAEFKYVLKSENTTSREEYGHQKEEMFQSISYIGLIQNESKLQLTTNAEYGNCYTLSDRKYMAWRSGPNFGIKLTLNLEINEYVANVTSGYGVRIVFHEPGSYALPAEEGITLSPGTETSIGLRMVRITRLGQPYGDCIDDRMFQKEYKRKYSIAACDNFCRIHKTTQDCNCLPVDAPDHITFSTTDLPYCDTSNTTDKLCLVRLDVKFNNGEYQCGCKGPCKETSYSKTLSSRSWPNDDYLYILIEDMCKKSNSTAGVCADTDIISDEYLYQYKNNFLRVAIYFEDLNFETIEEEPMYKFVRFLSDIGGATGLFLGASVLSFLEVFQLLLEIGLFIRRKAMNRNTTISAVTN